MNIQSAVSALIGDCETAQFAVAVSGGADSLALTLLMAEAFPQRVTALTVDHQLRADSAAEAAQVAAWCAAAHIPHYILPWHHEAISGNMQAQARAARYALLNDHCAAHGLPYVLTAHNRDDVAETLLMRLARGAGVRGLAAMRSKRPLSSTVTLLRPLLGISHVALVEWLQAQGQPWIEDPSNQNQNFDRVKARQWLAQPPLATLTAERLAMSAQALAQADTALDWAANRCFAEMATIEAAVITFRSRHDLLALPSELVRRLLLHAMDMARGPALPPRQEELERLTNQLNDAAWRGSTLGKCQFAPVGTGFRVKSES
jgi:tRNA(Ile)-lysidine synthase